MRWRKSKHQTVSPAQKKRRAAGVILWVCAIIAGIVGGEFGWIARSAEISVQVIDAAVEHGDLDAASGHALALDRLRADVRHGLGQVELVIAHRCDAHNGLVHGELGQHRRVHFDEYGIQDDLRAGHDPRIGIQPTNPIEKVRLLIAQVDLRLGGLRSREAELRNRWIAQSYDDSLLAFRRS